MTKLTWGTAGERFFEAGTDRGVLYVDGSGYAWTGLTGVKENPSGGDPRPYYIDGVKYLNIAGSEEFEATIEGFTSPREFDRCDGTLSIQNGLFITQQPRKPFDLSYRTKIGNDIDGPDHAYKIHLVYNALAKPSGRSNQSLDKTVSPMLLSWGVTTTPPLFGGYKPSAHLVIDSRYTPSYILETVEGILYGDENNNARLPDPLELVVLFSAPEPTGTLIVEALADGTYTISGDDVAVRQIDTNNFEINGDSVISNGDGTYTITSA